MSRFLEGALPAVALLALILSAGMAPTGHAASRQPRVSVQHFQLSDQHGRMQRIEPSPENTLIYFYRGDW